MSKLHNKKRNVGIIYEQIVSFICNNLVENKKDEAKKAISIIKEHFSSDTQLYKEYKLFSALVKTKGVSEHLATAIISEAKKASNNMFDSNQLEKEKSSLIKSLNYSFGKGKIFEEKVKDYRKYATIQTLLNEWRNNSSNFEKLTDYEVLLHNNLTESHEVTADNKMPIHVDSLTYNLMKKKFNENYVSNMSPAQKNFLENYINGSDEEVALIFSKEKKDCLNLVENYIRNCDNKVLIDKNKDVIDKIYNINENNVCKENLQKFLMLIKLKEEILGE